MLKNLLIKNYALIEHTEIFPSPTLNIITGETGAGKSIMLGALGLLKGGRADTRVLSDQDSKCVIEATFDLSAYQMRQLFEQHELDYEELTTLRREITPQGKSRAFINDTPVRLEVMKAISDRLMDIHSQHDTLLLGASAYQLGLVDAYARHEGLQHDTASAYGRLRKAEAAYQELQQAYERARLEFDYNSFQLEELDGARLEEVDQEALEQEQERIENAESLKGELQQALGCLTGTEYAAEGALKTAAHVLSKAAHFSPSLQSLSQRAQSCLIELSDIAYELEREEQELFFDQERIQLIKDRLDEVYTLQQKHRLRSVQELIELRESLRQKVEVVANFDEQLLAAEQARQQAMQDFLQVAGALSEARQAVLPEMVAQLDRSLQHLGMPNAHIELTCRQVAPSASGIDEVDILFTANKGRAPQPLKEVASGGEFSRLMLAVKYMLASRTALPTIVFDEIDTGISGEIAIKMGQMMSEMARRHQVIAITHLPQIAAMGSHHYYVYKDHSSERTVSRMRQLSEQERLQEIAQMIGGANPSEMALNSARELRGAGLQ